MPAYCAIGHWHKLARRPISCHSPPPRFRDSQRPLWVKSGQTGGHRLECDGERSTHECGPPLRLDLISGFWLGWQLENRRLLTLAQEGQKHDLAIRKFQRIVMSGYFFFVDLPKDRRLILDRTVVPRPQSSWQTLNFVSKGQLGPWAQTATFASSDAANPRVPVPKSRVVSLSPTLAGRDLML